MADGSTRPVEAIRVGDLVLGFDDATGTMKPVEVEAVHAPFVTDSYYIIDGTLRVTDTHPVLSRGMWIGVGELEVGDLLTDVTGKPRAITSIDRVDETARTYTFQVKGGSYVAAGVVVHNKEICEKFMALPEP
jgi:hypothetical protein